MGKLIRFRRQAKGPDAAARPLFPPFLGGATDARPAAYRSDASASVDGSRAGTVPDPEIQRKRARKKRGAVAAFLLIFVGGTAAALFGDHGYLDVKRQRLRYEELKAVHAERLKRVDALRRDIDRLRDDPSAIERIAREDLGFVAKGEITLLLPGEDPAAPRTLDAKTGSANLPDVGSKP